MDREGYQNCRLIEQEDGLVLQVARSGEEPHGYETFLFTREELLELVREAIASRVGPASPSDSSLA